jgi:hypothetical protein
MQPDSHVRTIVQWFVFPLVVISTLLYGMVSVTERIYLQSLADLHGTETSKAALTSHVTNLLKAQLGNPRANVHRMLDDIGGRITSQDDSPGNNSIRESVYWTLADPPGPIGLRAVWILYYDSEDRLTEVVQGEVFP